MNEFTDSFKTFISVTFKFHWLTTVPKSVLIPPFKKLSKIVLRSSFDVWALSNPQLAKKQPLKNFELISVFGVGYAGINYYPQGLVKMEKPRFRHERTTDTEKLRHLRRTKDCVQTYTNYPKALSLRFSRPSKSIHPTQKPIELLEYLIKTYTNEGEIVLDNAMGSGSTGVACLRTNRKFIGIELDDKYFDIACNRISECLNDEE